MTTAYIGVGSNHDAEMNLKKGIRLLREEFTIKDISPVYESAPVGDSHAAAYLNAALAIETELQPAEIKSLLVEIEAECGRVRVDAEGNKSNMVALDFDLLLYSDAILAYEFRGKTYQLPHGDILKYAHVAVPLAGIAGDIQHPTIQTTLSNIAAQFNDAKLLLRNDIAL